METTDYSQQDNSPVYCPACSSNRIADRWPTTRCRAKKTIMWCGSCGFGWQHPLPTPEEIRFYYDHSPTYNFHDAGEKTVGFQRRIRRINRLVSNPGRLLDIGSGLGDFLNLAINSGWEATGIEPQASAAKVCQERFGVKPRISVFDQIDFEPGIFDAVTVWDVWEHVHNHLEFIDRCISLLAPEGLLALSVPNASGYPARLFRGRWRYVMFTHLNYFKMAYVDSIMARRGMHKAWTDNTVKVQSLLQGIEGFLPITLNTEKIIRMGRKVDTVAPADNAGALAHNQKKMRSSAALLNRIRRFVHKVNLCSLPISRGDMMDLYYRKIE